MLKLIIGLGNPGKKYENTRHNIGFKVAETLAAKFNINLKTKAFNSLIGKGRVFSQDIVIALPQTYMNRSGEAVSMLLRRKRIPREDFLVICDDANLSEGIIRIRQAGTSGGHNGLESIIESIGFDTFSRLRIGIGRSAQEKGLSDYVLSSLGKEEIEMMNEAITSAVECCEFWIKEGVELAASGFNLKNRKG